MEVVWLNPPVDFENRNQSALPFGAHSHFWLSLTTDHYSLRNWPESFGLWGMTCGGWGWKVLLLPPFEVHCLGNATSPFAGDWHCSYFQILVDDWLMLDQINICGMTIHVSHPQGSLEFLAHLAFLFFLMALFITWFSCWEPHYLSRVNLRLDIVWS